MSHDLTKIINNISIDCVIFGFENYELEILLIKRGIDPFTGEWALPGGFILKEEELDAGARRILYETTGVKNIFMEQIAAFGGLHRYPERRVFTVGYFALIAPENYDLHPGIDTKDVQWVKMHEIQELPFDHNQIVSQALKKLRARVRTKPIGFELLPEKFTLPQLQILYEEILGKKIDKRNFRKKIQKMDLLEKLEEKENSNVGRSAYLYKFDQEAYNKFKELGFIFDL
ncbi:MAG: NUDIX hydrolase [Candidatus Marinimicrobia bacterium]|nr:NUDIX hydrolase [Candidatus Neomarinimicrobiota bacterium]